VIQVSEHDGGRRPQPHLVRRLDHLQPLARAHFIRTQHGAHLVVQNLGRRSGQRAQPGSLESLEERFEAAGRREWYGSALSMVTAGSSACTEKQPRQQLVVQNLSGSAGEGN
jgi:hypothetical protein